MMLRAWSVEGRRSARDWGRRNRVFSLRLGVFSQYERPAEQGQGNSSLPRKGGKSHLIAPSQIRHTKTIYRDEMELQSRGYICVDLDQSREGMLGDPILVSLNCSTHRMRVAR